MLTVYTSSEAIALKNIRVDYEFPENGLSAWEQLEWMDEHLDEFRDKEVSIKTFSPYILNYLNLMLIRGDVDYSNLEVYEAVYNVETESVEMCDLKILNESVQLIDATLLSEPISHASKKLFQSYIFKLSSLYNKNIFFISSKQQFQEGLFITSWIASLR